jgi:hypothetical protein
VLFGDFLPERAFEHFTEAHVRKVLVLVEPISDSLVPRIDFEAQPLLGFSEPLKLRRL